MIEEKFLIYYIIAGIVLILLAYWWCVARAFRQGRGWGILALIPPFFLLWAFRGGPRRHGQPGGGPGPVALALMGLSIIVGTITLNAYHSAHADLGPYEKIVDGQVHLTLTKWDGKDYSVLTSKPEVVVLQMANADVTNDTLKFLKGLTQLEELDVNDTQIDDEGLALIAALPKLRIVRLARTKITDEGFTTHLGPLTGLVEVDVRKTGVKSKTLRDWKNADKDNRKYLGP